MALDFLLIPFLLAVLWGLHIPKRQEAGRHFPDYLSPSYTSILKGVFCLTVVFHHLAQRTEGSRIFQFFQNTGYLSVAVFFFVSGYGLMTQYRQRGSDYLKGFFKYRFCAVGLPLALFLALYALVIWYCERLPWLAAAGKSVWLSNSWFMVAILFFYLCFFVLAKLLKRPGAVLLSMLLAAGLYHLWRALWAPGEFWWYNSYAAFFFGMLWALYHQRLTAFFTRFWAPSLAVFLGVLIPCFHYADSLSGTGFNILLNQLASAAFCGVVFLLAMKLRIGNRFLVWLGGVSMELYLIHGLLLVSLRCTRASVPDDLLFTLMVLVFSLALSGPVHCLMTRILPKRMK